MRLYFDNCCFNRPFDVQSQIRVRIETEAKLELQRKIDLSEYELAWSYVLDFENSVNPFPERRLTIAAWKRRAVIDAVESDAVLKHAQEATKLGLSALDALHVGCAIAADCNFFVTTDDRILKRIQRLGALTVISPVVLISEIT